MAKKEETRLSIVIRAVDNATAKIKAINERLDAATKPVRDFKKALGDLKEKSGLNAVIGGFKGVGSAIKDLLGRLTAIGAVAAAAVYGIKSIIDEFDTLGDTADRVGLSVDALAQLRYAAQRSGVEVNRLDKGLENFSKILGQAKAGTGSLKSFLDKVSPALLKQLKAAKGNEEAFNLLAAAMVKLKDPAKRAALAQQAFGDASVATLLARGPDGIAELRRRYLELAGPQGDATAAAGEFGDSMDDLKASTDGIKAAIVTGLAPALKIIVERLREWFTSHREDIKEWAKQIGEKLPGAVAKISEWIGKAYDKIVAFVDAVGGIKNVAIGAAAILAGPLLSSIVTLASALLTALSRAGQLGKALLNLPTNAGGGAAGAAGSARSAAGGGGALALGGPIALGAIAAQVSEKVFGDPNNQAFDVIGQRADEAFAKGRSGGGPFGMVRDAIRAARPDITPQTNTVASVARAAFEQQQTTAKVTVDFANAPRGTRATVNPQSTADVDLSVGYNLLPGVP